ncbi:helix-turn-helix domain-containing protein [uncultured Psychrobacter sp.]|uniref:helix-turn-helix domain-containing protein n=1 Tax=unclassified Psychrobacter TaxID=196806 RepID=UPI00293D271F|nr:helix-turn-helix domain-containing protein [uncultured Psychrobacter sp.]
MHVERVVRQYFVTLGDDIPTDLYELILKEVERPLLSVVLEQTRGNQSKCAQILGLNRGTLRKKLKTHNLM